MMLKLAKEYPEYSDSRQGEDRRNTASAYYGKGYQDVQNRVPKITNTCEELGWKPTTTMPDTLRKIFSTLIAARSPRRAGWWINAAMSAG